MKYFPPRYEQTSYSFEFLEDGTRFCLPPRKLENARKIGWGVLVFGAFVAIFMVYWMTVPISGGLSMLQEQKAFGWGLIIVFGLVGMGGLLLALCIDRRAPIPPLCIRNRQTARQK